MHRYNVLVITEYICIMYKRYFRNRLNACRAEPMRVNEHITHEPDDSCSSLVTLGVSLQGVILMVSNTITITTVYALAINADAGYLSWAVFTAMLIGGVVTALQANRLGRLGPGYILMMGPGVPFMAVCVLAVEEGSLAVMSSLLIASSLVQFALAIWLAQLRRVITPVVSGVAFMTIAVSAMPIAIARLNDLPAGASPIAGPIAGAVTLAVGVILMLRASGYLRFFAMPAAILAGCIVAAPLGVYDLRILLDTPWFALPEFAAWPGLSADLSGDFWAFLIVFFIVSAVVAVRTSNEGSAIQQVSWRTPRAIDFRAVQGTLNVAGVSTLLSGIAGTIPVIIYLPSSISLISFTGVAARRAGYVMGIIVIALALLPKIVALLLTIPRPVTGALLMIIMGLLFVEGVRAVLQGGLNQQKALIVGLSLSIAVGLQSHNVVAGFLGDPWGVAFGNSVVVSVLAAVLMSMALEMTFARRRRLEVELEMSALSDIDAFLRELGDSMRWDQASIARLCAAGEETLSSMLQLRDDHEEDTSPRLVLVARPGAGAVEIEFFAAFAEENIEDRIAFISEQAETPEVNEISFRLLRHYASSVRHRKYHGIEIVAVQVDGSRASQ